MFAASMAIVIKLNHRERQEGSVGSARDDRGPAKRSPCRHRVSNSNVPSALLLDPHRVAIAGLDAELFAPAPLVTLKMLLGVHVGAGPLSTLPRKMVPAEIVLLCISASLINTIGIKKSLAKRGPNPHEPAQFGVLRRLCGQSPPCADRAPRPRPCWARSCGRD